MTSKLLVMLLLFLEFGVAYVERNNPASEWQQSFKAGFNDTAGNFAGGSEVVHLANHNDHLFAANGYWEDPSNVVYGGKDITIGWAQVLRLDKPDGAWVVDLDMGLGHIRTETLKSIIFTTDGTGKKLANPVKLLVASTWYWWVGEVKISIYVRNDQTGSWSNTTLESEKIAKPPAFTRSVRTIHVHQDQVTGVDRVFLAVGTLGIFSGVYDPTQDGKINWGKNPEISNLPSRPLSVVDANNELYFSSGTMVYRRNDGHTPSYSMVHDHGGGPINPSNGGIRGLSPILNPSGTGESLLFSWVPNGQARGCMFRLDPDNKGGFVERQEECLDQLMHRYLNKTKVHYVLGCYSGVFTIADPQDPSGKTLVHLIGFEAGIYGGNYPTAETGFYAGAVFAIRRNPTDYFLNEIGGARTVIPRPALVSTRAFSFSPFNKQNIYFGGYDCNNVKSHNTAWIFRSTIKTALTPLS